MARHFALALSLALVAAVNGHEWIYNDCKVGLDVCPDGACTISIGDPAAAAVSVEDSVNDCDALCSGNNGCQLFTYNTITNVCTMKHTGGVSYPNLATNEDADVISGWQGCTDRVAREGDWGMWEAWTLCLAHARFRYCDSPPPLGSGSDCPADGEDAIVTECVRVDCEKPVLHTDPTGSLHTPLEGTHGSYPCDVTCQTLIHVDGANSITLTFSQFSVEESTGCSKDYMEIYDGPSVESPFLVRLCGSTLPDPVTTTGDSMLVIFVADNDTQLMGFNSEWDSDFGQAPV